MRSMAVMLGCAPSWNSAVWPMCWRSRQPSRCGPTASRARRTARPPASRWPARPRLAAPQRRGWCQGTRVYDWARVALVRPGWPGRGFWLLVRRRLSDGELAFYACFGPARTSLAELVRVAGIRWAVEMVFPQLTKGWMRAVG